MVFLEKIGSLLIRSFKKWHYKKAIRLRNNAAKIKKYLFNIAKKRMFYV